MKQLKALFAISVITLFLTSCGTEVGSDEWCADLKEKPKGEWTMDETGDYAKHCLLK